MLVPLESVQNEWEQYEGPKHLQTVGNHFHIFKDVFGGEFRPRTFFKVRHGSHQVLRGNILNAAEVTRTLLPPALHLNLPFGLLKQTLQPPDVTLPSPERDELWTLVLSNPDGNLRNYHTELLHWMM